VLSDCVAGVCPEAAAADQTQARDPREADRTTEGLLNNPQCTITFVPSILTGTYKFILMLRYS